MSLFKGAGVALVTPFKNGKVDYESLANLIDWQISQGIDAIISCGTTGEASTLTDDEHIEVVRFTVETADKRVPVIGGAGSNDTNHAIDMSQALEEAGADGILSVTPYYNKCTQKGLVKHYEKIADEINIPIILYSVPSRTSVNISPAAVFELAKHPNIAAIKEASGNMGQVVEIAKAISDDFDLYSGNDEMVVPILSMGGIGTISTVANIIPSQVHNMVYEFLSGDTKRARQMQIEMKSLIDAVFMEVNPIPIKAAVNMLGYIEKEYRLPLCEPESKTLYEVMYQMKAYGLLSK